MSYFCRLSIGCYLLLLTSRIKSDVTDSFSQRDKREALGPQGNWQAPKPAGFCSSTKNCPQYHMCREGQCWPSKMHNYICSDKLGCVYPNIYECDNSECKIPAQNSLCCMDNAVNPLPGWCYSTEHCPQYHMCRGGKCWPSKQQGITCSGTAAICSSTKIYQYFNGECKIPGDTIQCCKDSSVQPTKACSGDPQCPQGYLCVDRKCWPSKQFGFTCSTSQPCAETMLYKCINNECKIPRAPDQCCNDNNALPVMNKYCRQTAECPQYYMCRNGGCWPSVQNGVTCKPSPSCSTASLYQCIGGQCKIGSSGGGSSQCCSDSRVQPVLNFKCQSTSDCPQYTMCREKRCWPSKQANFPCVSSASCPVTKLYKCVKGECKIA